MLEKLDPEHIKFAGSEVEVDPDNFMAQGHVSSFNGVKNAAEFEDWFRNAEADGEGMIQIAASTSTQDRVNACLVDPVAS